MSDLISYNILDAAIDARSVQRVTDYILSTNKFTKEDIENDLRELLAKKLISAYIYENGNKKFIDRLDFAIGEGHLARDVILDQNENTFEAYRKLYKKFEM